MDISEVAQRSGLPASTLRYYEERGLIESIGRRGLRRTFDHGVLRRLALITLCRSAGFSLKEITTLIGPDGQTSLDRQTLAAKADELDATISKLSFMSDKLRRAAACPALNHSKCDKFQSYVAMQAADLLLVDSNAPPRIGALAQNRGTRERGGLRPGSFPPEAARQGFRSKKTI